MRNLNIYYTEYTPEGAEYLVRNSDLKKYNVKAKRLTYLIYDSLPYK
ncbi:unnamed protein product [marine sediment metagenome]|uniref:Uncharacterized protein n=1 Tax=marine sediment metagenome TaxID=412755 RepID=X1RM95_9ZZZZ